MQSKVLFFRRCYFSYKILFMFFYFLHQILHHDIQSANILVNVNRKVKIANFGLSKKFSDITRNILHNLENIRYLAPEKLLLDNDENSNGKKKVPYDSKCEIYR